MTGRALRLARPRASRVLALALVLLAAAAAMLMPALARADGDPGSDELLSQNLFTGNLDIPARQQLELGALLDATATAGAPVRVAVISSRSALGTVTPLWREPQAYADYLGTELSLTYTGRLLVIMPDGFGVYWHGDPAGASKLAGALAKLVPPSSGTPSAYAGATVSAVNAIEAAAGVGKGRLASLVQSAGAGGTRAGGAAPATNATGPPAKHARASGHELPGGVLLAVIVALLLLYIGWRSGRLRELGRALTRAQRFHWPRGLRVTPLMLLPTVVLVAVVAVIVIAGGGSGAHATPAADRTALATNPHIDPGTMLTPRAAPGFALTDQTGRTVSLKQFRGKVVLLAFVDSECQTICPLTTAAMLDAQAALGRAGKDVQLLGINANWKSTQVDDVINYTELHGMAGRWDFLTGSLGALTRVWKDYGVDEHEFLSNEISHVAAMFLIDPRGRLRESFTTYPSYTSVPQVGQLLAQDAARLLPSHPRVLTSYSYAERPQTPPTRAATLTRLGGGSVQLGPGKPHLYLFFATWDTQSTPVAAQMLALNAYARAARAHGLPPLTAIDEGSVEPSPRALPAFIRTLPKPLAYPVGIDADGSVADGYGVEGEPWFVLTNAQGKVVWNREVYTQGWPSLARIEQAVHDDLSTAQVVSPAAKLAAAALAGSPPALAALHTQASQVLPGGQSALDARIRALRGHPVVLNIWGSWCGPCKAEFGELAQDSVRYGKRVAFLGADYGDSVSDASVFLKQHHVSYPSYQVTSASIDKILVGGLQGTPTTVYIGAKGKVRYVHEGPYTSVGALSSDIQDYALAR